MDVTSLLLSGARMTASHCPRCSFPLFAKDGKTFCPNCTEEEKRDDGLFKKKEEDDLLHEKEEELLDLLKAEKDPEKMKPLLECLLLIKRIGEHNVSKRT